MSIFRLAVLPAEEGDCLVIAYGPDRDKLAFIVVDGGRASTSVKLRDYLSRIGADEIELVVVTHVDADHIEGLLGLVGRVGALRTPKDIWFNGYRHLIGDLEELGPVQGETFTTALLGLNWNMAAGGAAIRLADDGSPQALPALKHGLRVTTLSPSVGKLRAMAPVWSSACAAAGLVPDVPTDGFETRPGIEVMGADLSAIASTPTARDGAKANGTSIALLVEYAGRTVVLGADAHPDLLTASLLALGGGRPLPVDLFKLPHHGSQGNVTVDLLKAVRCRDFVISTNGRRFDHPDEIAIARVVTSSSDRKRLWFNYRQRRTECWEDEANGAAYAYDCRFPVDDGASLEIDVLKLGIDAPRAAEPG